MKIMSFLFWVFYFLVLFVSVWYITQVGWGDITAFEVIESCGIVGGLLCLGDFFKKEAEEFAKDKK